MLIKRCSWGTCESDSRFGEDGDRPVAEMQGVVFFPFPNPKNEFKRCKKWVQSCGRKTFTIEHVSENSFICSKHFKGNCQTDENPDPIHHLDKKPPEQRYTKIEAPLNPVKITNNKCQDFSVINTAKSIICVSCRGHFETIGELYSHIKSTLICSKWYNNNPQLLEEIAKQIPQRKRPLCILFRAIQKTEGVRSPKRFLNVDEYFYATTMGDKAFKRKIVSKMYSCYSCGKNLKGNLRFMSHARHKVLNVWEKRDKEENKNTCLHCYRKFDTDFERQCHVELVHLVDNDKSQAQTICKICDLFFTTEHGFLQHMKATHFRKETPYLCHVCNYRSSLYTDVVQHFKQAHENTGFLQCCFCLQVRDAQNKFLTHTITHVKDCVHCTKCRLLFVSDEDLQVHLNNDHGSNSAAIKGDNLNAIEVYVHINNNDRLKNLPRPKPKQQITAKSEPLSTSSSGVEPFLKRPKFSSLLPHHKPVKKFSNIIDPAVSKFDPYVTADYVQNVGMTPYLDLSFNGLYNCMECTNMIGDCARDFLHHYNSFFECRLCTYVTACKDACVNHIEKEHADPDYVFGDFEETDDKDEEFNGFGTAQKITGIKIKKELLSIQECEPDSTNDIIHNEGYKLDEPKVTEEPSSSSSEMQCKSVQTTTDLVTKIVNQPVKLTTVPLHVPVLIPSATTCSPILVKQIPIQSKVILPPQTPPSLMSIPKQPTFIRFSHITARTVVVEWGRPKSAVVTQYKILFQGTRAQICKHLPPNRTVVRLIDLTPDTNYDVEVYSLNGMISSECVKSNFSTLQPSIVRKARAVEKSSLTNTESDKSSSDELKLKNGDSSNSEMVPFSDSEQSAEEKPNTATDNFIEHASEKTDGVEVEDKEASSTSIQVSQSVCDTTPTEMIENKDTSATQIQESESESDDLAPTDLVKDKNVMSPGIAQSETLIAKENSESADIFPTNRNSTSAIEGKTTLPVKISQSEKDNGALENVIEHEHNVLSEITKIADDVALPEDEDKEASAAEILPFINIKGESKDPSIEQNQLNKSGSCVDDAGQVNIVSSSDSMGSEESVKKETEPKKQDNKESKDKNSHEMVPESKNEYDAKPPTLEDFKIAMSEDVF